jgi:hypothetical protein
VQISSIAIVAGRCNGSATQNGMRTGVRTGDWVQRFSSYVAEVQNPGRGSVIIRRLYQQLYAIEGESTSQLSKGYVDRSLCTYLADQAKQYETSTCHLGRQQRIFG